MCRLIKRIGICLVLVIGIWCWTLLKDRDQLNRELIRLHVVANSDSREDQAVKLQVRDAINESLRADLEKLGDVEAAKTYLEENLPKIRETANMALEELGFDTEAAVTLCKETFDTRYYDTFSLPAGVYETLRVTIGKGEGKNWWCVTFPTLCVPETSEAFEAAATDAGFSSRLSNTLTGEEYRIRFFLLDLLGQVENILFME